MIDKELKNDFIMLKNDFCAILKETKDDDTILEKLIEKGWRKELKTYICKKCGKEYQAYWDKSHHGIFYMDKEKGLTQKRIEICNDCSLELFNKRTQADIDFYNSLTNKGE